MMIAPGARAATDTIQRIRPFIYVLPQITRSVISRSQSPLGLDGSLGISYFRLVLAIVFSVLK